SADVEALQHDLERALGRYRAAAAALSQCRHAAAAGFAQTVTATTRRLGMGHAEFAISILHDASARPRPSGDDDVRFDFSANPGQPPRPLARVASGGELSRLSLAIQVSRFAKATQADTNVGTMIFDEVDAGIGGAVAAVVGDQLRALGARCHVLCVTHLAQVAAQGQQHFAIRKTIEGGNTHTEVLPLTEDARISEIARMLGGTALTPATEALARDLLAQGRHTPVAAPAAKTRN
ncbi:MAG: hypothetical protein KF849_18425, partial [Rhizobiaceae bacterium]|nr:hypothetical protein [Rhizobiaceae bacterium]